MNGKLSMNMVFDTQFHSALANNRVCFLPCVHSNVCSALIILRISRYLMVFTPIKTLSMLLLLCKAMVNLTKIIHFFWVFLYLLSKTVSLYINLLHQKFFLTELGQEVCVCSCQKHLCGPLFFPYALFFISLCLNITKVLYPKKFLLPITFYLGKHIQKYV